MFLLSINTLREKVFNKLSNAPQKLDSLFSLSVYIFQSWSQTAIGAEWVITHQEHGVCAQVPRCLWSGHTEPVKRAYRPLVRSPPCLLPGQ